MLKISKNLYDAIVYANDHLDQSLTQIAQKFKVDRHSISKHKNDYALYNHLYNDEYYYISEEELEPVNYFLNNPNSTLTEINQKFGVKGNTIQRRLAVLGIDYNIRYKKQFNRNAFNQIQTEEDAYWLGFILADGYINEDRYFLKIKLGLQDKNHLLKFAKYMLQNDDINLIKETGGSYTKDNICYSIEYDSKTLIQNLQLWNLHLGKSGLETPINLEEPLKTAYIRGMIDGDGHIEKTYFKYVGSLLSCEYIKNYFSQFYDFLQEHKYIYLQGTIYSFEIRSTKVLKILQHIYLNSTIYLDRKYNTIAV